MSELADDLDRLCGEAAASGVKHWQFPLSMIRSLAAALRESEECRRDAERYRWLRDAPDEWDITRWINDSMGFDAQEFFSSDQLDAAIDAARKEGV